MLFIALLFSYQDSYCISIPTKKIDSVAIYTENGEFQKGLAYSNSLSNHFLKQKKYNHFCKVILQQATIYNLLGDNESALNTLFRSLKVIRNKNEKFGEIILTKKIAEIYILMKDYKMAKTNLYSVLKNTKKVKNDSLLNRINQSLFKIHMLTKSDSSLYYLKAVNDYYRKIGDDLSYYILYSNNFNYYIAKNNPKLAKINIDSCVYYAKKSQSTDRILLALGNLVYYQVETEGDYKKGKETYLEMFKIAKDTTSLRMAEHYFSFGSVLQHLGDYKEANKYLIKSTYIKDSLYKKNISSAVRHVEMKYKLEKIEKEYKAKHQLLIAKQLKNKKLFIIIISLFIIIVILFYFFFQNTRLKQKNKLKDIKNKMQQNMINASIDGQEIERKKIAAFLHDNISGLLTSAGLHLSAFSSQNQLPTEEITKTKAILEEAHDKVRDLSHELLPALLSKFGLFYALQDLCEKNTTAIILFEYSSTIATRTRYNEKFEMKIYNIISELFNNIIKHSQASKAKLTLQENNNLLMIQVSDNGKGFDTEKFEIGENFGLNQIQARIDKMNGTFSIYSRIGSGTSVTIKVPYLDRK